MKLKYLTVVALILAGVLLIEVKLGLVSFRWKANANKPPTKFVPSPAFINKRNGILTLDPNSLGLRQNDCTSGIWGLMLERNRGSMLESMVVLKDGTIRMLTSQGRTFVGLEQYSEIADLAKRLFSMAAEMKPLCTKMTEYPYPKAGCVRLYVLTFDGVFSAETYAQHSRDALSPIFYEAWYLSDTIHRELKWQQVRRNN